MVSYSNRRVSIVAKDGAVVKNIKVSGRRIDVPERTNWLELAARTAVYTGCLAFCVACWWVAYHLVFAFFAM